MHYAWRASAAALALAVILLVNAAATIASAQIGDTRVVNSLDRPVGVVVNGTTIIIKPKSSISVEPDSLVCVASRALPVSDSIRLAFSGWLVNGVLTEGACIVAESGSILELFYEYEYLVIVNSSPEGLFSYQEWSRSGTLEIQVPRIIETPDAKYLLNFSSVGLLRAVSENTSILEISVASPLVVNVYYDSIYHVRIVMDTYGLDNVDLWVKKGRLTVTTIQPTIMISDKERLVLTGITSSGADTRLLTPLGTIEIVPRQPGAEVFPIYAKYYLVRYETAAGVTEKWVQEGGQVTIDAMAQRVQDAGDRRLTFMQWEGDIVSMSPVVTITVDRPLELKAVYRIEWKVTVDSLIGTREYWVPDGETQIIFVPPELPGVLIGRQLDFYLVNGQRVDPGPGGFLKLGPVKEPVQVVAVYKSVILWNNIAVLAGLLIGVVLIYIAYDMYVSGWGSEEEEEEQEEKEEPRDETKEEEPREPSVGPWAS